MFCVACGKELPEGEVTCTSCAVVPANTEEQPSVASTVSASKNPLPLIVLTVGMILLVILAFLYIAMELLAPHTEEQSTTPTTIEENEMTNNTPHFPTMMNDYVGQSSDTGYETSTHTLRDDATDYSGYYKNLVQQEGVEWLASPTPRGDLKLFQLEGMSYLYNYQYWQIGTYQGEPLLYVLIPCDGMCVLDVGDALFFYGSPEKGYHLIVQESADALQYYNEDSYYKFSLTPNVYRDETLVINALNLDESLTVGDVTYKLAQEDDLYANSNMNAFYEGRRNYQPEFIADTKYGPLFRDYIEEYEGLTVDLNYGIRLPGGLYASLNPEPSFIWEDRVPRIGWLDGTDNTAAYRTDGIGGCGFSGPEIMAVPIDETDLQLAGHTITNESVYVVTNPFHPLIDRLFEPGSETRYFYEYNEVTQTTESFEITREQFIKERGVVIYKDPFGLQHVLTHTKYGPQAECAKPVVYLYPESPMDISVSLDALVTKSEPPYKDGWQVSAQPDGTLSVSGTTYDSLFWDGYGNGEYPTLTEGFVVLTEEAMPLMEQHLRTMGFSEKEITDFVEFWAPLLPSEPYTRFAWIGTRDMEKLAKLTITPAPDTLIRAFVDFEGLSEEVAINPQTIPSYERKGYVATEWGGLLRK